MLHLYVSHLKNKKNPKKNFKKKIYWGTKKGVRLYREYKLEEKPDKYTS